MEEMQFEDSLGQQTSLSLSNIVRNQPLAADQFRFTPPEGVEIIDTTEE
ncbi:MAG: outer-membrane lipoprotein carrier protein LolA [Pseudohongiellaceae bacterium]